MSFCSGGVCIQGGLHPGGLHLGGQDPGDLLLRVVCVGGVVGQTPPPPSATTGYGQRPGDTHPTGMHTCSQSTHL